MTKGDGPARAALREKLARLGATRADDRVSSGAAETLSLSMGPDLGAARTISAILALRRRHVPALEAIRPVEAAVTGKPVVLIAPMVEDVRRRGEEIEDSGFTKTVDVSCL